MYFNDLYNSVLIQPYLDGADELRIVSGYATSVMAKKHIEELGIKIDLIVGMCPRSGISVSNHAGFQYLTSQHRDLFRCFYSISMPVHTKLYIWYRAGVPYQAYTGSANYTQQAFILDNQSETLTQCNPLEASSYFQEMLHDTIECNSPETHNMVNVYCDISFEAANISNQGTVPNYTVELPLTNRSGIVPPRSGLNWGQRDGRNPNQAYIKIPSDVARSGFFPPRSVLFTVTTDDGYIMTMSVNQGGDKALHTPENNAIIGKYFRRRLGVSSGHFVTTEDLERYGRNTVTFTKFDNENYKLDFS